MDLERRTLVDVLPDRSADTFARWLVEYPGVEIVSRDRGREYAEAARRAVPHAVQVADRFHLLKNLRDVVLRVCKQHTEVLDLVPTPALRFQRLTNLRLDRRASKERMREQTRKLECTRGCLLPYLYPEVASVYLQVSGVSAGKTEKLIGVCACASEMV